MFYLLWQGPNFEIILYCTGKLNFLWSKVTTPGWHMLATIYVTFWNHIHCFGCIPDQTFWVFTSPQIDSFSQMLPPHINELLIRGSTHVSVWRIVYCQKIKHRCAALWGRVFVLIPVLSDWLYLLKATSLLSSSCMMAFHAKTGMPVL